MTEKTENENKNILDSVECAIRRHSFFDLEHKYVANILWVVGTYFLKRTEIKVFDAFPMLAFMSPEPDSGKSRALDTTRLLSYNPIDGGSHTTATLLYLIDQAHEKGDIVSIFEDEIDTKFTYLADNSDLIRLFNNGYERDKFIARMKRFADGISNTPAYCPKAFAGLKVAKIPAPTKSRTIIIGMHPKRDGNWIEDYIDLKALAELRVKIEAWSNLPKTVGALADVSIPDTDIAFLNNRDRQLWLPLIAIARINGDPWYRRALNAAKYFTEQTKEKNLSHLILLAEYRVFRSGEFEGRIHSDVLLEQLHELGIPRWVDFRYLAEVNASYDPKIKPRQMKIGGSNKNGYDWHLFFPTFRTPSAGGYISEKEVEQVELELGIRRNVDQVDEVDSEPRARGWGHGAHERGSPAIY